MYATGSVIRARAEVGIAIHVPILLHRIAPNIPIAGHNVASLYFHPVGSILNISHTANPHTSICIVMALKHIPMMPNPKISLDTIGGSPAASSMDAAMIGEMLVAPEFKPCREH